MSQSYFSITRRSTSPSLSSTTDTTETLSCSDSDTIVGGVAHSEDPQQAYSEKKDLLVQHLQATKHILSDLRSFNKNSWVIRYPQVQPTPSSEQVSGPATPKSRGTPQRTLSFADSPHSKLDVNLTSSPSLQRSFTLPAAAAEKHAATEEDGETLCGTPEEKEIELEPSLLATPPGSEDFHVLRLDLKLGHSGFTTTASPLVSQLEKSSIAALLDERIAASVAHLDKLETRLQDKSSKVLVTGDLNAGKSTFVNALLQRDIMPTDQQPCTNMFCEVHDALLENNGKEEAHVVKDGVKYDINDESTFTRVELKDLYDIVSESDGKPILKLYVADTRSPDSSLLNNGVVDISLIDAPGLNRDMIKTIAVFSRQPEIDVIVFCVSAENHFTLSGKEFLETASREKAHIFIVVNRFDQIRNKEKCKRMILEQIRQFSPRTFEDSTDLVHFVDSSSALARALATPSPTSVPTLPTESVTAFETLQEKLRNFVLVKRTTSKLSPAATYLVNILQDLAYLCSANAILGSRDLESAKAVVDMEKPIVEQMKAGKTKLESGLDREEEETTQDAAEKTKIFLEEVLDRIGDGQIGVTEHDMAALSKRRSMPSLPHYPGLLNVYDYAQRVRQVLLESIDIAVKIAEDDARALTSRAVDRISALSDKQLPEGIERSRRVFVPAAMFSQYKGKRRNSETLVAGGAYGLGIGLASNSKLRAVSSADIFDIQHQFTRHFGDSKPDGQSEEDEEASISILSILSLGISALMMVGGKSLGVQGLVEGFVRVGEFLGNENSRKWAAPVVCVATAGLGVYLVIELPNSIPRNVGRRIQCELSQSPSPASRALSCLTTSSRSQPLAFIPLHERRISHETRKVIRLASQHAREQFKKAMDASERRVQQAEEQVQQATKAKSYFEGVVEQVHNIRDALPDLRDVAAKTMNINA